MNNWKLRGDIEKHRIYLETIMHCDDIAMRPGHFLENGNLVPNLRMSGSVVCAETDRLKCGSTMGTWSSMRFLLITLHA